MRHHAKHIATLAQDAGDAVDRTVDVPLGSACSIWRDVAEPHPPLALQPRNRFRIGRVIALAVGTGHADHLTCVVPAGESGVGALYLEENIAADELELRVAHQNARQQSRLTGNLETVAYGQHQPATRGMGPNGIHN